MQLASLWNLLQISYAVHLLLLIISHIHRCLISISVVTLISHSKRMHISTSPSCTQIRKASQTRRRERSNDGKAKQTHQITRFWQYKTDRAARRNIREKETRKRRKKSVVQEKLEMDYTSGIRFTLRLTTSLYCVIFLRKQLIKCWCLN